ncbi:MAG: hypothetical protein H0T79_03600, partial [Deltaproteobacteria bacterium]|nr:hypothetical protein [Deltaproteobacteria bacterium]
MTLDPVAIRAALREGRAVDDPAFDTLYPPALRFRSEVHWTPIEVALRVAELLDDAPGGHVLDIGAAVGKVCVVGALTTSLHWHGIERDAPLVRAAQRVARTLEIEDRTTFVAGDAAAIDWSPFGGFYLFNPFAEGRFGHEHSDPALRRQAFAAQVAVAEAKLATVRPGSRVVTYHGFGGELPEGYELVARESIRTDELCLWVRRG